MRTATIGALAAGLWLTGCSYDWDAYDPRLGDGADASAGTTGSGGSSAGAGGTASGGTSGVGGGGGAGAGGSGGSAGSGTGGSSGNGGAGGSSGSAGAGGTAGSAPMTVTFTPEVSDCISLTNPDPDACETASGAGVMSVDTLNSALANAESAAFLSFDVDNTIAGKQVLSVTLQLQATSDTNAEGDSSGEVWEVAAFTRPDLFNAAPAKQGSSPLAQEQGAVASLEVVSWLLPTNVVAAGQMVYVGVFPLAQNGVDYYSKAGAVPPKLIVTYQ